MKEVKPIEIKDLEDGQEIKNLEKVNGGAGGTAYVYCSRCNKSFAYENGSADSKKRADMDLRAHYMIAHRYN